MEAHAALGLTIHTLPRQPALIVSGMDYDLVHSLSGISSRRNKRDEQTY